MTLRIGSLFTGTGALDLAVMDVYDAEVVWHSQYEPPDKNGKEDTNQYAAQILKRHWPDVPNLGDVTKVDWHAVIEEHGPIDILTGGFPCQDVSAAGKRAGLTPDSRSGLWTHMAYAISILQPRLVIIENVEGLLSAPADRGLELDAEALDQEARAGRILRALGAVLGDLASLRLHAEWARVGADEVGAPHRRRRIIIYAWPSAAHATAADERRLLGGGEPAEPARRTEPGHRNCPAADTTNLGHERDRGTRHRGHGPADGHLALADTSGAGRQGEGVRGPATERGGVAPDTDGRGRDRDTERNSRQDEPGLAAPSRLDPVGRGVRGEADADTQGHGRNEGRPQPARQQGRLDAAERGGATPSNATRHAGRLGDGDDVQPRGGADGRESAAGRGAPPDADRLGQREDVLQLRPGQPDLDWGDYEPAIRRWERILGRPAPWPTDAVGRLSPVFTEWLMGLPDGWVTDTPGLTRPAMLRALGNGVVWQQAAAAIRLLHQRAAVDDEPAAA